MLIARRTFLIGLGLAGLEPALARAAAVGVEAGNVVSAQGPATGQRGGERRTLAPGALVYISDTLGTGPQGRLAVQLGSATRLSLGERTRIKIDKFLVDRGGELVLERGAMLFDRPDAPPSGPLSVATPFGLIAARGTKFFAGPSQGTFGVFVEHGLVTVRTRVGAVTLTNGLGTNLTSQREAPSPPKAWGVARITEALASVS
jgi:ferric-dicitrate binding protein FerR (iron transport regulator)